METIYYSLDAKRLTLCGEAAGRKASGGQETVCYAFVPHRKQESHKQGVVLDFDACRRALEGREPEPAGKEQRSAPEKRFRRGRRLELAAELFATAAIVVMAVGVLLRFFAL